MESSSPAKKLSSLAVTEPIIWKNYSKIKEKGNSWEMGSEEGLKIEPGSSIRRAHPFGKSHSRIP